MLQPRLFMACRGANGVVLITTRKGKEGSKPVISARAEFSILQPTKMPKMANAARVHGDV